MPIKDARKNFEKQYLINQVKRFGWNISKTANFIGMERSALHRKIKEVGMDKWIDDILDNLDVEKTKTNIEIAHPEFDMRQGKWDTRKFLEGVWEEITNPKLSGAGVILENVKRMRVLEFQDGKALIRYNDLYGHENLAHAIFQNMDSMDHYLEIGMIMGYGHKQKVPLLVQKAGGPTHRWQIHDPVSELR